MKPNHLPEKDPQLTALLQEWKVSASLPPRFQERVWQRVAQAETTPAREPGLIAFLNRIHTLLLRPRLAATYLSALLLLGFAAGWTRGTEKSARLDVDLSQRYVHMIDPYQGADSK